MEFDGNSLSRLDRVEGEVGAIQTRMAAMDGKIDIVASALTDIKTTLRTWESSQARRDELAKPPVVAIVSVLISVIAMLVGGAYLIGGQVAQSAEVDKRRDREINRLWNEHDRLEERQSKLQSGPA
jgi:hypothetical protein